jgi:diguanylate cyclase (GGDEF)-like protein
VNAPDAELPSPDDRDPEGRAAAVRAPDPPVTGDAPLIGHHSPLTTEQSADRLLVIGRQEGLLDEVRRAYPAMQIDFAESYMGGIVALSRPGGPPRRAVIADVDASQLHLDDAVAGLREAAGPETKLILCCTAEAEPTTRRIRSLSAAAGGGPLTCREVKGGTRGIDDYLVYPLRTDELDAALGYARPSEWNGQERGPLAVDELAGLSELIGRVDAEPRELLRQMAESVRSGSGAEWASIVVEGSVTTAGALQDRSARPLLTETIRVDDQVIGQISLGPLADRPYRPADAEKLRQYAAIAGRLLEASGRHRRWRALALTDEVSGLPNRRYLAQFLERVLARARVERSRVTVLVFDIDDFKCYNDRCGHAAGDEIIREVGALFRRHCREQDIVTRYGGDEFAVVFWDAEERRVSGSNHPDDPLIVLDRFTEDLANHEIESLKERLPCRLTISGGLASYPWDASTAEDLLRLADEALIKAKGAGKNRIFIIGEEPGQQPEA